MLGLIKIVHFSHHPRKIVKNSVQNDIPGTKLAVLSGFILSSFKLCADSGALHRVSQLASNGHRHQVRERTKAANKSEGTNGIKQAYR